MLKIIQQAVDLLNDSLLQGWGTLILEGTLLQSLAPTLKNPGKKYLTASWRPWLAASGVFDKGWS